MIIVQLLSKMRASNVVLKKTWIFVTFFHLSALWSYTYTSASVDDSQSFCCTLRAVALLFCFVLRSWRSFTLMYFSPTFVNWCCQECLAMVPPPVFFLLLFGLPITFCFKSSPSKTSHLSVCRLTWPLVQVLGSVADGDTGAVWFHRPFRKWLWDHSY